jgi:prepilin-type N-terminal cleavage/methylation domain-containing protein
MKSNGFTMIELLVVMAVIVTITALLVGGYNNFNQTERLRQSGKDLKTNLRLAQTKATSGLKPSGCSVLDGYRVTFDSSSYTIQALCGGALAGSITTITLPDAISFSPAPTPNPLLFSVLTGLPVLTNNMTITLGSASQTHAVLVSTGGDITDLGLQ